MGYGFFKHFYNTLLYSEKPPRTYGYQQSDIQRYVAELLVPYPGEDLPGGVHQVVQAHRAGQLRRHHAAVAGTQRSVRLSHRETLHPVPPPDNLPDFRTEDQTPLFDTQPRTSHTATGRLSAGSKYYADFKICGTDRYGKYKKSVRHTGYKEDSYRLAAQPQLHVRYIHRRRLQPAGPFGGNVHSGQSGQYGLQSAVRIRRLRVR